MEGLENWCTISSSSENKEGFQAEAVFFPFSCISGISPAPRLDGLQPRTVGRLSASAGAKRGGVSLPFDRLCGERERLGVIELGRSHHPDSVAALDGEVLEIAGDQEVGPPSHCNFQKRQIIGVGKRQVQTLREYPDPWPWMACNRS